MNLLVLCLIQFSSSRGTCAGTLTAVYHSIPPPDLLDTPTVWHSIPPPDLLDIPAIWRSIPPPYLLDIPTVLHSIPPPDLLSCGNTPVDKCMYYWVLGRTRESKIPKQCLGSFDGPGILPFDSLRMSLQCDILPRAWQDTSAIRTFI